MGYKKIQNLYKNQTIFLFKECYSLEKIHGTSAHIKINKQVGVDIEQTNVGQVSTLSEPVINIHFFAGGSNYTQFVGLFNEEELKNKFKELNLKEITIYGEAYGGKLQGMSKTYGPTLKFVAFEVQIGDNWLEVPWAEEWCKKFNIEFVPYNKIPCTLEAINIERDTDSIQAVRNGMGTGHIREGVVLRPLVEFTYQGEDGGVIRVKHKRDEFKETKTSREVLPQDLNYLKVLQDAQDISEEWCTEERLRHVVDKVVDKEDLGEIIKAMLADIEVEAEGEIVMGKEVRGAISKKTVKMYKEFMMKQLQP